LAAGRRASKWRVGRARRRDDCFPLKRGFALTEAHPAAHDVETHDGEQD